MIVLAHDQAFTRAQCCQPLPGERIVGIVRRGHGVVVHAIDCANLIDVEDEPDRWLDIQWADGQHPAVYTVALDVTIGNDAGVLGRVCTLIGERSANISDLHFLDRKPDFYRLRIDVDLSDAEQLHSVISALEAESDVAQVERWRDTEQMKQARAAAE